MPFDPKIIRHDDEGLEQAELELLGDLAILGEQLHDDAQRLATCYPPKCIPAGELAAAATTAPRRRWTGRLLATTSAGVGAAALGLLLAFVAPPLIRQPPTVRQAPVPVKARSGVHPSAAYQPRPTAEQDRSAVADARSLTPAGFSGELPVISPTVLERGITGPEMEAWMDLRQTDLAMDAESIEF